MSLDIAKHERAQQRLCRQNESGRTRAWGSQRVWVEQH